MITTHQSCVAKSIELCVLEGLSKFNSELGERNVSHMAKAIAITFENRDHAEASVGTRRAHIRNFLEWFCQRDTNLYKKLRNDIRVIGLSSLTFNALDQVTSDYRDFVGKQKKLAVSTKNNKLEGVDFLVGCLASNSLTHRCGAIPKFNDKNLPVKKKTMAQSRDLLENIVEGVKEQIDGILEFSAEPSAELYSFAQTVLEEGYQPTTATELKQHIVKILGSRISDMRRCAENDLIKFRSKLDEANNLADQSDLSVAEIEEVLSFYYQLERWDSLLPSFGTLYSTYRHLVFRLDAGKREFFWSKKDFLRESLQSDAAHARRIFSRTVEGLNKYTGLLVTYSEDLRGSSLQGWNVCVSGEIHPVIDTSLSLKTIDFKNFFRDCSDADNYKSQDTDTYNIGLRRLLLMARDRFEGTVLGFGADETKGFYESSDPVYRGFISAKRASLPNDVVNGYFNAYKDVYGAFIALICVDTAINADSLRKIENQNILLPSSEGYKSFTWLKPRSNKLLQHHLPIECSDFRFTTVEAFELLRRSTERIRSLTGENCLFASLGAYNSNKANETISSVGFLKWFKVFCARHESLKDKGYTVDTIRPSVLLLIGLSTGDPYAVMDKAGHSCVSMALHYTNRLPMLLSYEKKMREFMHWLQVVYTINIEDFPQKLGIDLDKYNKTKEDLMARHFGGINCLQSLIAPQEASCQNVKECMSCEHKSSVVIGTVENIVSLLQWQDRLIEAQKNYSENQLPIEWYCWKVFVDSVLDRLQTGSKRRAFKSAMKIFSQNENPYPELSELDVVLSEAA